MIYMEKEGVVTERLLIRPLTRQDEALYLSLYTDARVMRHISEPLTHVRAEAAFNNTLKIMARRVPTVLSWVICDKGTGESLGTLGFRWSGEDRKQADIGIMLLRHANGKLIPEEAMGALMQRGFETLGLVKIRAQYARRNLATERFVKKLGFEYECMTDLASDDWRRCVMDSARWRYLIGRQAAYQQS